jgi:hypothetical protein
MIKIKDIFSFLPSLVELFIGILLLLMPYKIMTILGNYYKKRVKYFPIYKETWFNPTPKSSIIAIFFGIILIILALHTIILGLKELIKSG